MALVFTTNCPHCSAENSPMAFKAEFPVVKSSSDWPYRFELVFSCPRCSHLVIVSVATNGSMAEFAHGKNGDLIDHLNSYSAPCMEKLYPTRPTKDAPGHIPPTAERCFLQAEDNHQRGHTDSAGAMYRKTVDVATKALDSSLASKKLAARIEALYGKGLLTDSLKDWAHNVRLDGNDATHDDEELDEQELEQLAEFTRYFLIYAFTLPQQVALKRGTASQDGQQGPESA